MATSTRDWVRPDPPNDNSATGFFVLPREIRDKIYRELLIYPDSIFLDVAHLQQPSAGNDVLASFFFPRLPPPGIVQLNTQVHREATAILYSANRFSVENVDFLARFLDQIGQRNAGLLRHLVIPFPDFHNDGHLIGITLREDSRGVRALDLIQERCQGLVSLETSLTSTHAMEIRLDELDSPRAVDQALALVDARFKAIPLLRELYIHLYDEPINLALCEKMSGHGWTIKTTTQRESESDDDNRFDYDSYEDYDDYEYDSYERQRLEEEWWDDFDRRNTLD